MTDGQHQSSLGRECERIADGVAHWTPARWRAATGSHSKADAMHRLVQRIADLAAEAEGQPRHAVPRLEHDTALPNQLRVVTADLVAAEPTAEQTAAAREAITAARTALFGA